MAMYDVFRAAGCLQRFGECGLCPPLVDVIESYLSNIAGRGSGAHLEAAAMQEPIYHLHKPDNLFVACSSLAVNGPTWLGEEKRIPGSVSSQGPRKRKSAWSSPSDRFKLNTATFLRAG